MSKISKEEAQQAVKTLLKYIGEDPEREGLKDTPRRVVDCYSNFTSGYSLDPKDVLKSTFNETGNFRDFVLLRNIKFSSLCEHHMLPVIGHVDIAYIPGKSVIGISKLARIVEVYARRLQLQERMTAQIAHSLQDNIDTGGVAVRVCASHSCMTIRGVFKEDAVMETSHYTGMFLENHDLKQDFLKLVL